MGAMVAWNRRGPKKITAEDGRSPSPTAHFAATAGAAHAAYLSVDEAAALLRVDRKTIHRAVAAGELPYLRLGRVIRIPSAALAAPSKSA
jgi:excisionase family DNA binding protein